MTRKRKWLLTAFAVVSLGFLMGGDCEFDFDGFPGWGGYWGGPVFYDPYPVVYDPWYPCCWW